MRTARSLDPGSQIDSSTAPASPAHRSLTNGSRLRRVTGLALIVAASGVAGAAAVAAPVLAQPAPISSVAELRLFAVPPSVHAGAPTSSASATALSMHTLRSPRDAASGLATGKRMHKPFTVTAPYDATSSPASTLVPATPVQATLVQATPVQHGSTLSLSTVRRAGESPMDFGTVPASVPPTTTTAPAGR